MMDIIAYHLSFRSPLHIGERGVGLEATQSYIPADTLFSAICMAWIELYGVSALQQDLLDWYVDGDRGGEPILLSSAFPFANSIRFLPKPFNQPSNLSIKDNDRKKFKKVRYLSETVFKSFISDNILQFDSHECLNKGGLWASEEEIRELMTLTDDKTEDIILWETALVPHVTLDKITYASEIWHYGEIHFVKGAGLWFAVMFNPDHGEIVKKRFDACMRLLGDTGIGGKRNSGHGLFEVMKREDLTLPVNINSDHFVTLSPICPSDEDELRIITEGSVYYDLTPRRGWVSSLHANNLRRKTVWMFAEGSVLHAGDESPKGSLADVTPNGTICPHPVWRYGYAFPVEVKLNDKN